MEDRRLATILSHLSPSHHRHPSSSNRYEVRRTDINNDRKDVISLKLHKVSSNECRVEEVEETVQAGACIQNATGDSNNTNTTTKESEIDSVITTEDKQNIGSESAQLDREGSKRISAVGRNNTIVSRNTAMTGEKTAFAEDCIFCLIIQGRSPAYKLYEDEMCICILDVHPLTDGHSLIIPKAHFRSLELTPSQVAAAMCAVVPFLSMAIMQATNSDSFNLIVNSGKAAGQVVFHTHFHIIPRKPGDNLWRSESVCRPMLCVGQETSQLVRQIRRNLSEKGS